MQKFSRKQLIDHIDDIIEACERADICPQSNTKCRTAFGKHLTAKPICLPKRRWMYCHAYKEQLGMVFDKDLGCYILPENRELLLKRAGKENQ